MSTEYRRGIPGTAHVEAATRLGLLWRGSDEWLHRFRNQNGQIEVWYFEDPNETPDWEAPDFAIEDLDFRPICPDGTPVDWEVLDQEVARMAQPATVTRYSFDNGTTYAAPTTQPQGFRADLWRRICEIFNGLNQPSAAGRTDWGLSYIASFGPDLVVIHGVRYQQLRQRASADILTRWAVYQELKPLYDIVDGTQGEVAMPRDVEAEWSMRGGYSGTDIDGDYVVSRRANYIVAVSDDVSFGEDNEEIDAELQQLSSILDAVAERRVAERMRGQAPAPTVTSVPAQPEPCRFADVRPDRHGWRWWRIVGGPDAWATAARFEAMNVGLWRWLAMADGAVPTGSLIGGQSWARIDSIWNPRTIIPTDEQGNPVSWESINETARILQTASSIAQQASQQILGSTVTVSPTTGHVETPLPRFTADELDDVDHSATTTQDSATLKRGKLPTVEAIGKYREVMAKRNGTVAEAVKASGIDCEVAQYVLERWAGGLSDREAEIICDKAYGAVSFTRADIAKRLSHWFAIIRPTLDTSEPADTAAQRQRAEAAERKARMAALQAQLAKERAARIAEPEPELSRFALLEVDEAADPSKSIEAWKAQRAANERRARNTVRPVTVTSPPPAPKRKPFEVVDAQADGLSGGAAFAVLLSRAMNQNC